MAMFPLQNQTCLVPHCRQRGQKERGTHPATRERQEHPPRFLRGACVSSGQNHRLETCNFGTASRAARTCRPWDRCVEQDHSGGGRTPDAAHSRRTVCGSACRCVRAHAARRCTEHRWARKLDGWWGGLGHWRSLEGKFKAQSLVTGGRGGHWAKVRMRVGRAEGRQREGPTPRPSGLRHTPL